MTNDDLIARRKEEQRPLEEAGQGVSEGFEQAEADLIDNAEHGEGHGIPEQSRFGVEAERDPATYGEADEETVRD